MGKVGSSDAEGWPAGEAARHAVGVEGVASSAKKSLGKLWRPIGSRRREVTGDVNLVMAGEPRMTVVLSGVGHDLEIEVGSRLWP